jgi:hypothetical protein
LLKGQSFGSKHDRIVRRFGVFPSVAASEELIRGTQIEQWERPVWEMETGSASLLKEVVTLIK